MLILIVDDSKSMRMIVLRALQLSRLPGYTTLEAGDGREAFELIEKYHPDLVISDWNMPKMKGIDLLKSLRAAGSLVPFGFITSEAGNSIRDEALAEGASFIITKPFTPYCFERALRLLLAET